jgi:hypothetical protein
MLSKEGKSEYRPSRITTLHERLVGQAALGVLRHRIARQVDVAGDLIAPDRPVLTRVRTLPSEQLQVGAVVHPLDLLDDLLRLPAVLLTGLDEDGLLAPELRGDRAVDAEEQDLVAATEVVAQPHVVLVPHGVGDVPKAPRLHHVEPVLEAVVDHPQEQNRVVGCQVSDGHPADVLGSHQVVLLGRAALAGLTRHPRAVGVDDAEPSHRTVAG